MIITVLIALTYISKFTLINLKPIRAINTRATLETFQYIREHTDKTDKNAIFIFRKPRVLTLFTDRRAAAYGYPYPTHPYPADDSIQWNFFRKINAQYILANTEFKEDRKYLIPFIQRNHDSLKLVYSNSHFNLYKITVTKSMK